jgi:hypothetical protein
VQLRPGNGCDQQSEENIMASSRIWRLLVASLALSVLALAGCVTHQRQAFDQASATAVKRIVIVEPPAVARYSVYYIKSGAGAFGALGGFAKASDISEKADTITAKGRQLGVPSLTAMIATELEGELTRAGYEVSRERAAGPGDSTKPVSTPASTQADAVLRIQLVSAGFWAETSVSPYQPSIRGQVTLTSTRNQSVLYTERLAYGRDYSNDTITVLPADSKYSFNDFDTLMKNGDKAFEGLTKGARVIAAHVAGKLRRSP